MSLEVKDPNFSHDTKDANGDVPDQDLLFTSWKHSGNGHIYTIIDTVWNSDVDQWAFLLQRSDCGVACVRTCRKFFSDRAGKPRYIQVLR
jgi:hypothetical protein